MDDVKITSQLDGEIIGLILISEIPPMEKEVWLQTLPYMKEEDKLELKCSLEREVEYEIKNIEETTDKFVTTLKTGQ